MRCGGRGALVAVIACLALAALPLSAAGVLTPLNAALSVFGAIVAIEVLWRQREP